MSALLPMSRPRSVRVRLARLVLSVAATLVAGSQPLDAQAHITSPREELGHEFGDDYFLANYQQISAYWRRLDRESDRMVVQEIGTTAEGRPHLMAIVTSPQNHRNLVRYREISQQLALADGLTDAQARALAKEGRAVVWIDGGLHASETLGAQQLGEMVYQLVSRNDEETLRFLDDVIILLVHANPDGNDLVADWYMRRPDPLTRSTTGLPRLYQKYIGHDNNRDFFASTQAETENINRVLYHEWFPQILYNHHQSGPAGTVVWSPPLRDPYNYNLHPMLVLGFQSLGAAMHTRLAVEGKPGATMRSGGPYDGWWNGGIRNTAAFHNTIALLTEMIGNPTPMRIPLVPARQVPSSDLAFPIEPQEWHFRQSVDYSITLNRAILDYASRMRENLLFNIYAMGRSSIERGSRDYWTANPKRIADVAARMADERGSATDGGGGGAGAGADRDMRYLAELRRPELRDPRGYIIPADQPDFPTAGRFISALRETGITVHRATREFDAGGRLYPAGSFVVFTAQSFRPHVIDMFEPQVHPDVIPYPGAPPTPPYDHAGWTLAFQMGVQFDRMLDAFTGPFERVDEWNVAPPAGRVTNADGAVGFVTSRRVNNAYIAVNRLLRDGEDVHWLQAPLTANGTTWPAGTLYVTARGSTAATIERVARELGVSFDGTSASAPAEAWQLRAPRVGLWDVYGGSMDSGWARWILEQFEFPFERAFAQDLNAGDLNRRFDVLVFVGGGIPAATAGGGGGGAMPDAADVPAEYHPHLGRVTVQQTLPRIREFIENGGTVVAIGSSATNLATFLELPLDNHLATSGRALERTEYYVPGSVLGARLDTNHPLAHGMADRTDVFFDNSPVFRLRSGAAAAGVRSVAWFDSATPLRSGWAWGQEHLEDGVVAVEAAVGRGRVVLYGPEILKRAQPHSTFKFLFNAIYAAGQR
ncbi:MAG: M14 metallopeptidase family protein [Gemmatimonadota bacterium]